MPWNVMLISIVLAGCAGDSAPPPTDPMPSPSAHLPCTSALGTRDEAMACAGHANLLSAAQAHRELAADYLEARARCAATPDATPDCYTTAQQRLLERLHAKLATVQPRSADDRETTGSVR